jgi:outer membrane immunogenic protein
MKRILLIGLTLGALGAPAGAADMAPPSYYPPPVYQAAPVIPFFSWTGCYIGADVGGAWSSQDVSNTAPPIAVQAGVTGTINGSSVIGGGYLGCNFQWTPSFVVGIEGDYSGTHLGGAAAAPNLFPNGAPVGAGGIAWTSTLDSIATVRGRIGYVWSPNVLLYVTGGGAWGRTSYSSVDVFFAGCPNCAATSFSNTSSGYVVGGGVEWAPWSNNWVVRAEYLYYKLSGVTGTSLVVGTPIVGANPVWNNMSISSGRVGVSYRFY